MLARKINIKKPFPLDPILQNEYLNLCRKIRYIEKTRIAEIDQEKLKKEEDKYQDKYTERARNNIETENHIIEDSDYVFSFKKIGYVFKVENEYLKSEKLNDYILVKTISTLDWLFTQEVSDLQLELFIKKADKIKNSEAFIVIQEQKDKNQDLIHVLQRQNQIGCRLFVSQFLQYLDSKYFSLAYCV